MWKNGRLHTLTQKRQLENKDEKLVGSILSVWSVPWTKGHPPGRERAVLCIKIAIKLAKWRTLLERAE